MPLNSESENLYPLELVRIRSEDKILYDRDTRGKSYFYLALVSYEPALITSDNEYFYTKSNECFLVQPQKG